MWYVAGDGPQGAYWRGQGACESDDGIHYQWHTLGPARRDRNPIAGTGDIRSLCDRGYWKPYWPAKIALPSGI